MFWRAITCSHCRRTFCPVQLRARSSAVGFVIVEFGTRTGSWSSTWRSWLLINGTANIWITINLSLHILYSWYFREITQHQVHSIVWGGGVVSHHLSIVLRFKIVFNWAHTFLYFNFLIFSIILIFSFSCFRFLMLGWRQQLYQLHCFWRGAYWGSWWRGCWMTSLGLYRRSC